ncbi:MAG: hypothetical protein E7453_00040 [Ruminococcaceae bacterium]|nr:hypothetical protein [Oscillospiraceae bacterium]
MKKGRVNAKEKYTEAEIRAKRKFPTSNTIWLIAIVAAQIALILFGLFYQPKPQDLIHQYDVTVETQSDGSLDITYYFRWEALDTSEPLTWVEIGMANENFSIYPDSVSSNISAYSKYVDEDYVSLRLDFTKAYIGGDVFSFAFKINQKDMLCKNEEGYFYEFVPCWFNAIEVKQYEFKWLISTGRDYAKRGSLSYGEYCKMTIQYGANDFSGCQTAQYTPFDDSGAYNELQEDKIGVVVMCCLFAALLIIAEVYIIDSYVSYGRGRGFLSGHGYYVHTYGRSNPHYIRARDRYNANRGGRSGGGGGGCACACACACAGGGRAGCSQKDTFGKAMETDV